MAFKRHVLLAFCKRSAGIAGDMIASDTSARQSGVKVGGGAMADADESVEPMQSSADVLAAACVGCLLRCLLGQRKASWK